MTAPGFTPPPYPYDRLAPLKAVAESVPGGLVDLSVGTPCDAPPEQVVSALANPDAARGYPPSIGTGAYRDAAAGWLERRLGVSVQPDGLAACMGTKELVAGIPHWLRLRDPARDTVLYPEVSYPTYAMGATLAGCRAVPVPVGDDWCPRLDAISDGDAARAVCLWMNTPGNPAGGLDDLAAAGEWGRRHGVPVLSDECYVEFTWDGPPRSILQHGFDGVLAVHSLSKRSNLAGSRIGFYAGDPDLVGYLSEVRKHAGFMPAGPEQAAGAVAWSDQGHVDEQRQRYQERLTVLAEALRSTGLPVDQPGGAFYLWVAAPGGDAWRLARSLAENAGALVSPGEFYGDAAAGRVRLAAVQPLERISLLADRLGDAKLVP
ncbi:MAG: aminotransferase class I/II-fold pyridoxal phosphate-dependent enzyme [Acidimicrobiales bacterium]|nr:aminotransferase class I/II-fold pyridoxal phosphate-dependent enzyme [Acidimicrobiales bacterium]